MTAPSAAVIGQFARDLVLTVDRLPERGSSAAAGRRLEQLGGKGANQAVALAQLGVRPFLIAVAGDDPMGGELLAQAESDGIDVRGVVRRPGEPTALIVEILEPDGTYRYVEHLPSLLTEADVLSARETIAAADAVLIQLQQPVEATLAAARIGREAGRLVVLDGEIKDKSVFPYADVVRADERESGGLGEDVLDSGPRLLAIAQEDGNLFVWKGGRVKIPLGDAEVVDTTGGGDSFVAALTAALLAGGSYEEAAHRASAASGSTVQHVGGRPELNR
ncbi:PfkB family carbohydrate kinase [Paractinoplanes ovalisporus]|uniref:PfkB family carbohydrate kinase n=1 Tax=Paractinoplanes ovalisporus TaxID=2810368 RepID=UPI0027DDFA32|nr:PfkB family carbohydrate kinase [Actinoplanes ovalisporus]